MKILGIETSCDESAVAILEGEGERVRVVSSVVASQIEIHRQYGGVVPEVAARQHVQTLAALVRDQIKTQNLAPADIDAIAVTSGPGLITALRVGVDTAQTLAWDWARPLVGVNHIEGHIYANWLSLAPETPLPIFPILCLVVSGGHTELLLMTAHGVYERLGETLDDAVGEAFDKTAKILGLPYPGGPEISRRAKLGDAQAVRFTRPMAHDASLNFSYSGLKTAVRLEFEKRGARDEKTINDLSASFQAAAVEALILKTEKAIKEVGGIKSLLVAGGVSANQLLRAELSTLANNYSLPLYLPDLKFAGDNAAMIAAAGYFRRREASTENWKTLLPQSNWKLGR